MTNKEILDIAEIIFNELWKKTWIPAIDMPMTGKMVGFDEFASYATTSGNKDAITKYENLIKAATRILQEIKK